jgi:hypothetical protein
MFQHIGTDPVTDLFAKTEAGKTAICVLAGYGPFEVLGWESKELSFDEYDIKLSNKYIRVYLADF